MFAGIKTVKKEVETPPPVEPCFCHKIKGLKGWCGVAGGGVPACDH